MLAELVMLLEIGKLAEREQLLVGMVASVAKELVVFIVLFIRRGGETQQLFRTAVHREAFESDLRK